MLLCILLNIRFKKHSNNEIILKGENQVIKKISDNITQLHFNEFGSCVYIIKEDDKLILIDTSSKDTRPELMRDLMELNINPIDVNIVLITHAHWDHTGNINLFRNAQFYDYHNINSFNLPNFQVHHVPGHTRDSIVFLYDNNSQKILFSGDTLFHNGIGRTDLPESEPDKMPESLNFLKTLNYNTLCPGHV